MRCLLYLLIGLLLPGLQNALAQGDALPQLFVERKPAAPAKRAEAHTNLGALYFRHGRLEVALEEANIALEADKDYHQAWTLRALVYQELGEAQKSMDDIGQALALAPHDPEVNNNYGWILCNSGYPAESEPYFNKAAKTPLYKTPTRAYVNAGRCSHMAGDLVKAESYFRLALNISDQKDLQAHLELAELYLEQRRYEFSQKHANIGLQQSNPPTAKALWLGIRLAWVRGENQQARDYAVQLRRHHKNSEEFQQYMESSY